MAADGTVYMGTWEISYGGSDWGRIYAVNGAEGTKKWEFPTGGGVDSCPAIGTDGTLYVSSYSRVLDTAINDYHGMVYALDGATGAKKWAFETGGPMHSSPAIGANGIVYVGSWDYKVYGLDAATGAKKWEFRTGRFVNTSPAVGADGTVYVGSWDGKVYALDGATGTKKWEAETDDIIQASPAAGPDGTVYAGSIGRTVYALHGSTGAKKWEFTIEGAVAWSPPALGADGTVYIGSHDQKVYALDGATGVKKWDSEMNGIIFKASPVVGADGTVYIASGDLASGGRGLLAFNGGTGAKEWEFPVAPGYISGVVVGPSGVIYVATDDGKLIALEGNSKGGPEDSPWPNFRGNAFNTGRWMAHPARIQRPIESGVALEGSTASLKVEVSGAPPPVLQWFLNGTPIQGATNLTYTIISVSGADEGSYTVVASNALDVVTTGPAPLGVNNVQPLIFPGLTFNAPPGTQLQVGYSDTLGGTSMWQLLTNLTVPSSPYTFVDLSSTNASQRFYRTTQNEPVQGRLLSGWRYDGRVGSRQRVEYVDAQVGYTNWQLLTNLTLPSTPYVFIDMTVPNPFQRYYRTMPQQ